MRKVKKVREKPFSNNLRKNNIYINMNLTGVVTFSVAQLHYQVNFY